jgi:hypothetical protein
MRPIKATFVRRATDSACRHVRLYVRYELPETLGQRAFSPHYVRGNAHGVNESIAYT